MRGGTGEGVPRSVFTCAHSASGRCRGRRSADSRRCRIALGGIQSGRPRYCGFGCRSLGSRPLFASRSSQLGIDTSSVARRVEGEARAQSRRGSLGAGGCDATDRICRHAGCGSFGSPRQGLRGLDEPDSCRLPEGGGRRENTHRRRNRRDRPSLPRHTQALRQPHATRAGGQEAHVRPKAGRWRNRWTCGSCAGMLP